MKPESPIYLALNMSKVINDEESFRVMKKVGPKVCITTATHPGFVGFQANINTGSHAYFDLHQEMFLQGDHAVYRPAGGYARIATIVKQIRARNQDCVLLLRLR